MVVSILLLFIILYVYLKYPHVFEFKQRYRNGRYIRLERESGLEAITFANFIITDEDGLLLTPTEVSVNPSLKNGDGRAPKSSLGDATDIVLIETEIGSGSVSPYIEYDLGSIKKIANIVIINRTKFKQQMQKTVLKILDNDRNIIFEKKITELQDIYFINIS